MSHSIDVTIDRKQGYCYRAGTNIWDEALDFFAAHYADRKLFIIIDSKVHRLHGKKVKKQCERYFKACHIIQIPEGEQSKSVAQWQQLQDEMLNNGVERSTPVMAVGGGVTGDLAGFAGASVLRGVPLIHMPTSLLAMVDSSLGGKTGINHSSGKNLIGSFYQPDAVFADIEFLETLDRREWIGGLAEMLKYAAIREPAMFEELEQAVTSGFAPSRRWMKLICQSASIKVDIVQRDVHESGVREHLNFGHTFGHALEKLGGFGKVSHGEAVYAGMLAAIHYSKTMGAKIDEARFPPFHSLYSVSLPEDNRIPDLIEAMRNDKKVKDETIRLVLLNSWGEPVVETCRDESRLTEAWKAAFKTIKN